MPFFRKKFSPQKTPSRKGRANFSHDEEREDLVLDNRVVLLQLGKNNLRFENGEWIPDSGEDASLFKNNQKLKKRIQELQEENNLFKVKLEILLNMTEPQSIKNNLISKINK